MILLLKNTFIYFFEFKVHALSAEACRIVRLILLSIVHWGQPRSLWACTHIWIAANLVVLLSSRTNWPILCSGMVFVDSRSHRDQSCIFSSLTHSITQSLTPRALTHSPTHLLLLAHSLTSITHWRRLSQTQAGNHCNSIFITIHTVCSKF